MTAVLRPPLAITSAEVVSVVDLTPRMRRITLGGPGLDGFAGDHPADAIKLLLPPGGVGAPPAASWGADGLTLADPAAEFELRTYTVRRFAAGLLDVDAVLHGHGPGTSWARSAAVGDPVTFLGPRRDFPDDLAESAPDLLLVVGDETAIPAAAGIAEALPEGGRAVFLLEVDDAADELALTSRGTLSVTWLHRGGGQSLADAVRAVALPPGRTRAWVAAESGVAVHLRRVLRRELGLGRGDVTAFGYWQRDRVADDIDADDMDDVPEEPS